MLLAEKLDQRDDLAEVLREWLQELAEDASAGNVYVDKTADGWMLLDVEDEPLMSSIIGLQTRINPVVSGKPPYPARIIKLGEARIRVEYPSPEGRTIHKSLLTNSFAASLGYWGEDPKSFLEAAGILEGAITSISADSPSLIQLKLTREYILRGLDRLLILNAAPQEVRAALASQQVRDLIAEEEALTLSTHILYVKLGVTLGKAFERVGEEFEAISRDIKVQPLPWKRLTEVKLDILSRKE